MTDTGSDPSRPSRPGEMGEPGERREPVAPLSEPQYRELLDSARAAPSIHDTRPWRPRLVDHRVEVWADDPRVLAGADPRARQLVISCGAAVLNLRLTMEHLGFAARTTLSPAGQPDAHLATVEPGPAREPDRTTEELHAAIADRRTDRCPHRPEPVDRAVALRLSRAARQEGAVLHEIRTREQRSLLHDALREALGAPSTDQLSRAELLTWLRAEGTADGAGGGPPAPAARTSGPLTSADTEALAALVERESFFLLATGADDRPAWLRAGQALQRVLLTAHSAGLGVRFLNQPIGAAALRGLLPAALDLPGAAQLLLRVGYPRTPVAHPA